VLNFKIRWKRKPLKYDPYPPVEDYDDALEEELRFIKTDYE
jgi:hypothetical protein